MPGNQTPSYGQIAPLPCGYLWQGKAKGVNPDRKSGAVPLRRLGGELHRLSGSTYGRAVDKTLRSTSLLSIAATHGLLTLCSGFSESTLLLSQKVLWRWASGVGGRHKMMLGAASHGPAHRRPGQDGRFPTHRGKGRVRQPPW